MTFTAPWHRRCPDDQSAHGIVGIGASAGGLDAFHSFFQNMASDSGLAFVVLLHLPAGRRSMLPDILARWTSMRVTEANDGDQIEANVVYVPPPHAIVSLKDGFLRIGMPTEDTPREHHPIDGFFGSLASELRERSIGIVLSGTGSDGTLGLKAIKECGGLTIAQGRKGSGPEHDGMPGGAIATGVVDLVAPVEAIPAHLLRLRGMRLAENDPSEASLDEQTNAARLAICTILRTQVGHDFSGYKDKTFLRRVQRRMQVLNIGEIGDYVLRLEQDHEEVLLLFRDLLIRVTSFFRDKAAFDALERVVMPRLFAGKHADGTVRVWVPGCATGEEAYSMAILLREQMDRVQAVPKVQVFATDIDEPAIAIARLGRYPTTLLEGLSPQRRERYFHATSTGYTVTREIRDLCTFSPHSIVRDPLFSRMDLISCRNLLIYMDVELQGYVIPAFHYSLKPDGILLLGSSESTARHDELFEPLDQASRIFRRRDVRSPSLELRNRAAREKPPGLRQNPTNPESSPGWPNATTQAEGDAVSSYRQTEKSSTSVSGRSGPGLIRKSWNILQNGLRIALTPSDSTTPTVQQLQHELLRTQKQLQSITEEHETALEELNSANEELHSLNEELQSTNEELETSKEETQSANEELHTVNAQLSEKVDELDRANSDLRNLFAGTEIATIFLDRHFIIRSFTPAVGSIYNLIPSDHGRPLTDIASQLRYDDLRNDVERVLNTLQPQERRVAHKDGKTHYIMRVLPYRTPDSTVSGTLITFIDVTSIVQAEQHQRLLVDELNHRVKNMLTVVDSLAAQTLRRSQTLEEFSAAFTGRVRALTASYSLLSNQNWLRVSLREMLSEEIKPFAAQDLSNIVLEGPDVRLGPAGALAMGMAIHELATNAVKYGSLSRPEGRVNIAWRFEQGQGGPELVLDWTEVNGPAVQPPTRRGFGITLIERGFAHELSGRTTLDFDLKGVRASLRAPVGAAVYAEQFSERSVQA
jgi:two-component system, chemotaxis family, CheB/CheR fusion protein